MALRPWRELFKFSLENSPPYSASTSTCAQCGVVFRFASTFRARVSQRMRQLLWNGAFFLWLNSSGHFQTVCWLLLPVVLPRWPKYNFYKGKGRGSLAGRETWNYPNKRAGDKRTIVKWQRSSATTKKTQKLPNEKPGRVEKNCTGWKKMEISSSISLLVRRNSNLRFLRCLCWVRGSFHFCNFLDCCDMYCISYCVMCCISTSFSWAWLLLIVLCNLALQHPGGKEILLKFVGMSFLLAWWIYTDVVTEFFFAVNKVICFLQRHSSCRWTN